MITSLGELSEIIRRSFQFSEPNPRPEYLNGLTFPSLPKYVREELLLGNLNVVIRKIDDICDGAVIGYQRFRPHQEGPRQFNGPNIRISLIDKIYRSLIELVETNPTIDFNKLSQNTVLSIGVVANPNQPSTYIVDRICTILDGGNMAAIDTAERVLKDISRVIGWKKVKSLCKVIIPCAALLGYAALLY